MGGVAQSGVGFSGSRSHQTQSLACSGGSLDFGGSRIDFFSLKRGYSLAQTGGQKKSSGKGFDAIKWLHKFYSKEFDLGSIRNPEILKVKLKT